MNKKLKIGLVFTGILIVVVFIVLRLRPKADTDNIIKEINPAIGMIETMISTTGSILPKNRLEIKPPVNGRVESV